MTGPGRSVTRTRRAARVRPEEGGQGEVAEQTSSGPRRPTFLSGNGLRRHPLLAARRHRGLATFIVARDAGAPPRDRRNVACGATPMPCDAAGRWNCSEAGPDAEDGDRRVFDDTHTRCLSSTIARSSSHRLRMNPHARRAVRCACEGAARGDGQCGRASELLRRRVCGSEAQA